MLLDVCLISYQDVMQSNWTYNAAAAAQQQTIQRLQQIQQQQEAIRQQQIALNSQMGYPQVDPNQYAYQTQQAYAYQQYPTQQQYVQPQVYAQGQVYAQPYAQPQAYYQQSAYGYPAAQYNAYQQPQAYPQYGYATAPVPQSTGLPFVGDDEVKDIKAVTVSTIYLFWTLFYVLASWAHQNKCWCAIQETWLW